MENEVLKTIRERRSIRKYKPEQISENELSLILEAGRFAPSGSNHQTTHLIVIQSREKLSELQKLVEQEFAKMDAAEGAYQSFNAAILRAKKGGFDFLYSAPTLVVTANQKNYGNAMADCSTALENMMLAAASLKVGSCWINQLRWLRENETLVAYLQKLGLGEDEIVCGSLALGYSDQKEQPPLERKGNPITFVR
jgi:nitroreductase